MSESVENPNTDTIKALSLMLLDMKEEEAEALDTMHAIKTACILQVEEEWEVTKDKALSNATKRNAEVELRLSGDEEYVQRSTRQVELHQLILKNQIELDFQRREFQRQNGNASITLALDRINNNLDGVCLNLGEVDKTLQDIRDIADMK